MAISIRLDAATESWVKRFAQRNGLTISEVLRKALQAFAEDAEQASTVRPYEALAPFIGRITGGPPDLSVRTGEQFRRLLEAKARRPHSR